MTASIEFALCEAPPTPDQSSKAVICKRGQRSFRLGRRPRCAERVGNQMIPEDPAEPRSRSGPTRIQPVFSDLPEDQRTDLARPGLFPKSV